MKKLLSILIITVLTITLVGCNKKLDKAESVADLLALYQSATIDKGFDIDYTANLHLNLGYTDAENKANILHLPVSTITEGKIAPNRHSHYYMDINIDTNSLKEAFGGEGEIIHKIIENYHTLKEDGKTSIDYTKGSDDTDWVKKEKTDNVGIETYISPEKLTPELFANATLAEEGNNYVVEITWEDLAKNLKLDNIANLIGDYDTKNIFSSLSSEGKKAWEAIKHTKTKYVFDKDTKYLTKVVVEPVNFRIDVPKSEDNILGLTFFEINISAQINLTNYGTVTNEDVAVPDDVEHSSTPEGETVSGSAIEFDTFDPYTTFPPETETPLEPTEAPPIETPPPAPTSDYTWKDNQLVPNN